MATNKKRNDFFTLGYCPKCKQSVGDRYLLDRVGFWCCSACHTALKVEKPVKKKKKITSTQFLYHYCDACSTYFDNNSNLIRHTVSGKRCPKCNRVLVGRMSLYSGQIPAPIWHPGDAVILHETKIGNRCSGRKEYGRVIDSFWDPKNQWYDVYVAFYGTEMPRTDRRLKKRPYVLLYLETSLTAYKEKSS